MNGKAFHLELVANFTCEAPKRNFMAQSHYLTGQVEFLLFVDKTRVDF